MKVPERNNAQAVLPATPEQIESYRKSNREKARRSHLDILIVEDQIFSQRLLSDIIRYAQRVNSRLPAVNVSLSSGINEGWQLYLAKAPDITFIDLNLLDGSGHTLTRAIKTLDSSSCVIIVTASNYEEELNIARENKVDGFIAKPYAKKQIIECIERYEIKRKEGAPKNPIARTQTRHAKHSA
jgi:CheY-like chemotaxis protein